MESLLKGFTHFREHIYPQQQDTFKRLASGQTPHTFFITCADSRVMPELMFNADPGELFVLRNIGNIVPPYSNHVGGVTAAIEYAVGVLGVSNIVVCGHTDCGAMKAVLKPESLDGLPSVAAWLRHADTARHVAASHGHEDAAQCLACLTEENIISQLDHLRTQPVVATRLAHGTLRIHGWIYDIANGQMRAFDAATGRFAPLLSRNGPAPEATPPPRIVAQPDEVAA